MNSKQRFEHIVSLFNEMKALGIIKHVDRMVTDGVDGLYISQNDKVKITFAYQDNVEDPDEVNSDLFRNALVVKKLMMACTIEGYLGAESLAAAIKEAQALDADAGESADAEENTNLCDEKPPKWDDRFAKLDEEVWMQRDTLKNMAEENQKRSDRVDTRLDKWEKDRDKYERQFTVLHNRNDNRRGEIDYLRECVEKLQSESDKNGSAISNLKHHMQDIDRRQEGLDCLKTERGASYAASLKSVYDKLTDADIAVQDHENGIAGLWKAVNDLDARLDRYGLDKVERERNRGMWIGYNKRYYKGDIVSYQDDRSCTIRLFRCIEEHMSNGEKTIPVRTVNSNLWMEIPTP